MSLALAERLALADTLDAVGPDRPTLCPGWTTNHLLAHLLVRERRPLAVPGILVPALAPVTDRAMRDYLDRPWVETVRLFRTGPPPWSPQRVPGMDALVNGAELFVHHEDVRRGEPGWQPRPPHAYRDAQVWSIVRRVARLLYRRSPVGVVLRRPDGRECLARRGPRRVSVVGEPAELLLHAVGRTAVRVHTEGDAADVAALDAVPRRL